MINNEELLKLALRDKYNEYGLNKTFLILSNNNQILLSKCNIDENEFNHILFRNYIYLLNSGEVDFAENWISEDKKETFETFNKYINDNDFEQALKIYENDYYIYQFLCGIYFLNLFDSESKKIKKVDNDKIETVYSKIALLNNTNLSFKREKTEVKTYQRISQR